MYLQNRIIETNKQSKQIPVQNHRFYIFVKESGLEKWISAQQPMRQTAKDPKVK